MAVTPFVKSAMEKSMFDMIRFFLPEGSNILELGSGSGSAELAKYYNMTCVEHNPKWQNKYDNINYCNVPISYCKPTIWGPNQDRWYDKEMMKKILAETEYDLLIVDGPPGNIGRCGLLRYQEYVKNVPIVVDDVHRAPEWKIAVIFSRERKWNIWVPSPARRRLYALVADKDLLLKVTKEALDGSSS